MFCGSWWCGSRRSIEKIFYRNNKLQIILVSSLVIISLYFVYSNFLRFIQGNTPYVGHWDEPYITLPASDIVAKGEFRPRHFFYPALPTYIAALGMSYGYIKDVSEHGFYSTEELGTYDFPAHERKNIILFARISYLWLALGCIVAIVLMLYKQANSLYILIFAVPAVLCSDVFTSQAKIYLNVDIVATFFAFFGLSYAIYIDKLCIEKSLLYGKIIPIFLCALTISSKYNYFPIAFVYLYLFVKYDPHWRESVIYFLFGILLVFFIINPYIVLNFNKFLYYTANQILSYQQGAANYDANPGFAQILYHFKPVMDDFTPVFIFCACIGFFYGFIINREVFYVINIFAMPYIFLVASQRLHYLRNFLPIYLLIIIYAGCGVVCICRQLCKFLKQKTKYYYIPLSLFGIVLLFLCLNFESIKKNLLVHMDTRNLVMALIDKNIPAKTPVVVADGLGISQRMFPSYAIKQLQVNSIVQSSDFLHDIPHGAFIVLPHYASCRDKKNAIEEVKYINKHIEDGNLLKIKNFPGRPFCIDSPKPVEAFSPALTLYYKE